MKNRKRFPSWSLFRDSRLNLTLVSLILGGCSTAPPLLKSPVQDQTPAFWSAGASNPYVSVEPWWTDFEDPQLDSIIRETLARNHDLKVAAARMDEAAAEARIAASGLYPSLQVGASASRAQQNFAALGSAGGNSSATLPPINSFGVSLDASWEIDLWGRVRSTNSAAVADFEAQSAQYRAAALSLSAQAAKAWFALAEARQQRELAQATVTSYRETSRRAADRVQAGVQSPADGLFTAADLAAAEALAQQREEAVRRSSIQLKILMGRYPALPLIDTANLSSVPALPAAGLPAELVSRRPDLVSAERRLAAAVKRVRASRAALYPRITLAASGGTSGSAIERLFEGDSLIWSIAGNLVQPIFRGGELRARVASADARERQASETFAQAVLNAFAEVETGLSVAGTLQLQEEAQVRAATNARAAEEVATNRYEQGVDPILVILEAQRRALNAQGAVISVRRQRLENIINLHLAMGGGFHEVQLAAGETKGN